MNVRKEWSCLAPGAVDISHKRLATFGRCAYRSVCQLRTYFCTSHGQYTLCVKWIIKKWYVTLGASAWHRKLLGVPSVAACRGVAEPCFTWSGPQRPWGFGEHLLKNLNSCGGSSAVTGACQRDRSRTSLTLLGPAFVWNQQSYIGGWWKVGGVPSPVGGCRVRTPWPYPGRKSGLVSVEKDSNLFGKDWEKNTRNLESEKQLHEINARIYLIRRG